MPPKTTKNIDLEHLLSEFVKTWYFLDVSLLYHSESVPRSPGGPVPKNIVTKLPLCVLRVLLDPDIYMKGN